VSAIGQHPQHFTHNSDVSKDANATGQPEVFGILFVVVTFGCGGSSS
jgi:hypothetical protein